MKKNAIITGANGNLGKAVSKTFIEAGYVAWDLVHDDFPFKQLTADHWQGGVNLVNEEAVSGQIAIVKDNAATLDVLVCAAGGFKPGNFQNTNAAGLEKMFELNFMTAFNIVKPVFQLMEEQGQGCIFLVGAIPGTDVSQATGSMAYAFSKSLIFRLAEFLNHQTASVKTYVLVPSVIDTPENRKAMPGKDYTQWVSADTIARSILTTCQSQNTREHQPIMPF